MCVFSNHKGILGFSLNTSHVSWQVPPQGGFNDRVHWEVVGSNPEGLLVRSPSERVDETLRAFLKWWVSPTNPPGFPTKNENDHRLGV